MEPNRLLRGFAMLGAAALLGGLADCLLYNMSWGLNVLLWLTALFACLVGVARWFRLPLAGEGIWFSLAVLAFAVAIMWRDSPVLRAANTAAIICALAIVLLRGRSGEVRSLGIVQGVLGMLTAALNALFAPILLICFDIQWRELASGGRRLALISVARGLLLALPLLLLFGALFAAADAAFAALVRRLVQFDAATVCIHICVIGAGAWLGGAFMRGSLLREDEGLMDPALPRPFTLGATEIGIALGALNGLFLLFVCLQIPYLFGGQSHVVASAGLTASSYARRGFFELVTVAGLVLPLLLGVQVHLADEDWRCHRLFRIMSAALLLLTGLVMASAVQRMMLYTLGFGLTELRLYTAAFMVWLAVLFAWYACTGLRGRRGFFFGAIVGAFGVVLALDIANPDALIVNYNVNTIARRHSFDVKYASSLSADAAPALVVSLSRLSPMDQQVLLDALTRRWLQTGDDNWRAWNLSRTEARQAANSAGARLRVYAGAGIARSGTSR